MIGEAQIRDREAQGQGRRRVSTPRLGGVRGGGTYWGLESKWSSEGNLVGAVAFGQGALQTTVTWEERVRDQIPQPPSPSSSLSPCSAPYWLSPAGSQRPGESAGAVRIGDGEGESV